MARLSQIPRWLIILNLLALALVSYFVWQEGFFDTGAACADVADTMMPACSAFAGTKPGIDWAMYFNTAGFGLVAITIGVDAWCLLKGFIARTGRLRQPSRNQLSLMIGAMVLAGLLLAAKLMYLL